MDQDRSVKLLGSVSFFPRMWIYLKGGTLLMPNILRVALASSVCGVLGVGLAVLMGGHVRLPSIGQGIAALALGCVASAMGNFVLKGTCFQLNLTFTAQRHFLLGAMQCLFTGGLFWLIVILSDGSARRTVLFDPFDFMLGQGLGGDWIFPCYGGPIAASILLCIFCFGARGFRWLRGQITKGWRGAARVDSWRTWMLARIESSTTATLSGARSAVKALREARSVAISKGVGDADGWARIESAALSKIANKSSSPSKPPLRL